jgi:hypothetical protein
MGVPLAQYWNNSGLATLGFDLKCKSPAFTFPAPPPTVEELETVDALVQPQ